MIRRECKWVDAFANSKVVRSQSRRTGRRSAFTLMEMLIVVAIIVALAGMGGFFFMGQLTQSKIGTAKGQAKILKNAITTYSVQNGDYPSELKQLLEATDHGPKILDDQRAIIDPWGREYKFIVEPDGTVQVWSEGDGKTGRIK